MVDYQEISTYGLFGMALAFGLKRTVGANIFVWICVLANWLLAKVTLKSKQLFVAFWHIVHCAGLMNACSLTLVDIM